MKPYFRAIWNVAKYNLIKIFRCRDMNFKGILLFGYNTKMSVCKTSHIKIGENVISDGRCVIIVDQGANLEIGDKVYFNENMMISAKKGVTIGNGCQFGPNVSIFDNNHLFNREHGVLSAHTAAEVVIGDNCWIASNVIILKGAEIGDNCIIGAGCVIKRTIPMGSIVTQETKLKIRSIN